MNELNYALQIENSKAFRKVRCCLIVLLLSSCKLILKYNLETTYIKLVSWTIFGCYFQERNPSFFSRKFFVIVAVFSPLLVKFPACDGIFMDMTFGSLLTLTDSIHLFTCRERSKNTSSILRATFQKYL